MKSSWAIDWVGLREFDYTCKEVAEGRPLSEIKGLVYKKDGKWYWFENCDKSNYGIHSYDSLADLITDQMTKHVKLASRFNPVDQDTLDLLHIYEYDKPKYGINTVDFKKFILNSEEVPIVD